MKYILYIPVGLCCTWYLCAVKAILEMVDVVVTDCHQLRIATSGCWKTFEALTLSQSVSRHLRLDITAGPS